MDTGVQDILKILISNGILVLIWWLNRNKDKAKQDKETESIAFRTVAEALEQIRKERADDREQIEANRAEALRAKAEAKLAQIQNEDCEFEHGITRLQLEKVLNRLNMNDWRKSTVFVLDDNELVTKVFTHRFKTIPVVNFKAFTDADICLMMAKNEKPEILILDYHLSETKTADDIIRELGYEPEIFIMSGSRDFEVLYKDTDIRFFYKDQFYIKNITKAILEHLNHKNK